MSPETAIAVSHKAAELEKALRRVIRGKDDVVRLALVSIFARGHLLIEGVPGVGKTTLGQALARAIDCTFQRVQFTSDMLPSDPEGTCVRIPAGPAERESLRQHMVLLPSMFDVARAIGQRGARHVETHHRVDRIGQQYWELLCALCTRC